MTEFKILPLPAGTEENYKKTSVRIADLAAEVLSRSANHSTATFRLCEICRLQVITSYLQIRLLSPDQLRITVKNSITIDRYYKNYSFVITSPTDIKDM